MSVADYRSTENRLAEHRVRSAIDQSMLRGQRTLEELSDEDVDVLFRGWLESMPAGKPREWYEKYEPKRQRQSRPFLLYVGGE